MKIFSYVMVSMVLLLTACADNAAEMDLHETDSANSHRLSIAMAMKKADATLDRVLPGETRQGRYVQSVRSFSPQGLLTRSENESGDFYVINYADEGGFVVMSTDERVEPVVAFSDSGNLDASEISTNPALNDYLNEVAAALNEGIGVTPVFPTDSLGTSTLVGTLRKIVPALYTQSMEDWDQVSLNKYVRNKCGDTTPVGCVALSCMQIMCYNQWPDRWPVRNETSTTEHYTFDWEVLKDMRVHDKLARFAEILGRPEYLNMNYRPNSSGTQMSYVIPTFKAFGYLGGQSKEFDNQTALAQLLQKKPFIAAGGGHAWTIDGAYEFKYLVHLEGEPRYGLYYHFSWGHWGGGNGYYLYDTSNKSFAQTPEFLDDKDYNKDGLDKVYKNVSMYYDFQIDPSTITK